jgi:hypothetical protein
MAYQNRSSARAKQTWQVGDIVKVGFVAGLEVVAKVATPGDGLPDLYALWQPSTNRFYQFVPHNGLTRCDSIDKAMAW